MSLALYLSRVRSNEVLGGSPRQNDIATEFDVSTVLESARADYFATTPQYRFVAGTIGTNHEGRLKLPRDIHLSI